MNGTGTNGKRTALRRAAILVAFAVLGRLGLVPAAGAEFPKPYDKGCTERENIFEFTKKPTSRYLGNDKYEITFAVKGYCDVTVGIVDAAGKVVRHLASGVLGRNAPPPFQKNSLMQKIYWNGKNDFRKYVKVPGALRVRVMLGLKPVFDKRLGGTSAKNIPGYVAGLAAGPGGVYVVGKGQGAKGHGTLRKFDHDGNYVATLAPPPANLPFSKLNGLGYVEYEAGRKAIHGSDLYQTVSDRAGFLPGLTGTGGGGDGQPAVFGRKIFWMGAVSKVAPFKIYYVYNDGSTDLRGTSGLTTPLQNNFFPRMAISPNGKYAYFLNQDAPPVVFRMSLADGRAEPFLGKWTTRKLSRGRVRHEFQPGSAPGALSGPKGLACDAHGRVYVADFNNARIQIFSAAGKYLKALKVNRPKLVHVHQKTGAIYVLHYGRVRGRSVDRITKFGSFDNPKEIFHQDGIGGVVFALDSWAVKPRVWVAGSKTYVNTGGAFGEGPGVRIFEERGKKFIKIGDFDAEARKEAGNGWFGRWSGARVTNGNLECDPVRNKAYYARTYIFDLKTGAYEGRFKVNGRIFDDIAFDGRGYLHIHWNPGFEFQGVTRVDPDRGRPAEREKGVLFYPEVPYDYGVANTRGRKWVGKIPVKDQPGAKFFQDGLGVNYRGDVAVESNIYYVPKMENVGRDLGWAGTINRNGLEHGGFQSGRAPSYETFIKQIREREKRGEKVYFIKRKPGLPLAGGTIWTFEWTGELLQECAVTAGRLVNGVRIDEDRKVYFVNSRPRMFAGKAFLAGRGGTLGDSKSKANRNPFTGTLIKTAGGRCEVLMTRAPIILNPLPTRPPDLGEMSFGIAPGKSAWCWVKGAEWLYAGASPLVSQGCSCPTQRLHLDWYKRTFVPEAYRHSFGVLDTAGNLIMHLGRYGNFDSGNGPKSKIRIGGDDIAVFMPRFISGTDDYLVFSDWSERLVVLKIAYHAEATVPVGTR